MQCVCCLEECSAAAIACSNDHRVCNECCTSLVLTATERLEQTSDLEHAAAASADEAEVLELCGRLRCPCAKQSAGGCDSEPYADAAIARAVSDKTFESYLHARTLLPIAQRVRKAYEEAQSALHEELGQLKEVNGAQGVTSRRLLAKQLKEQMPDARQCKECGFGPVDKKACDDLAAHHGQELGGGFMINNSCTRCGWFSPAWGDWPLWDGEIHEDQVSTTAAEGHALLLQSLEAAEEKAAQASDELAKVREWQADAASREDALRRAGERDVREIERQRKLAEQWRLEHDRAQATVDRLRTQEKRRAKHDAAAAMARLAAAKGCERIGSGIGIEAGAEIERAKARITSAIRSHSVAEMPETDARAPKDREMLLHRDSVRTRPPSASRPPSANCGAVATGAKMDLEAFRQAELRKCAAGVRSTTKSAAIRTAMPSSVSMPISPGCVVQAMRSGGINRFGAALPPIGVK